MVIVDTTTTTTTAITTTIIIIINGDLKFSKEADPYDLPSFCENRWLADAF